MGKFQEILGIFLNVRNCYIYCQGTGSCPPKKICQAPPQGIEPCATRVGISSAPSAGDLQAVLHHAQDVGLLDPSDSLDCRENLTLLCIGHRIETASSSKDVLLTAITATLAEPVKPLRESIERAPGGA